MAISKDHGKKAPSQNPVDFFEMKKHSGKPQSIPDQLTSGKQVEKIEGRKDLAKQ